MNATTQTQADLELGYRKGFFAAHRRGWRQASLQVVPGVNTDMMRQGADMAIRDASQHTVNSILLPDWEIELQQAQQTARRDEAEYQRMVRSSNSPW